MKTPIVSVGDKVPGNVNSTVGFTYVLTEGNVICRLKVNENKYVTFFSFQVYRPPLILAGSGPFHRACHSLLKYH